MKCNVLRFFLRDDSHASGEILFRLRVVVGLVLLAEALLVAGNWHDLYGSRGIIQGELSRYLFSGVWLGIEDLKAVFARLGLAETQGLTGILWAYLCLLVAMIANVAPGVSCALVWATHTLVFKQIGQASSYGVDSYAQVFLFYITLLPKGRGATPLAAFGVTALRLHLAMTYFSAGLEKSLGVQWWNGEVIWRALMMPEFNRYDGKNLLAFSSLFQVISLSTLTLEVGYPVLAFGSGTRRFFIAAILLLHLGIAWMLGLYLFSAMMIALNAILFLTPQEIDLELRPGDSGSGGTCLPPKGHSRYRMPE